MRIEMIKKDFDRKEEMPEDLEKHRYIPASELLSAAMLAQIDRIVEQQSDRVRLQKDPRQEGLTKWVL